MKYINFTQQKRPKRRTQILYTKSKKTKNISEYEEWISEYERCSYKWASEHAIIFDLFNAACGKGHETPKHRAHPETVFINSQLSRMGKTANPQTIKYSRL